MNQDNQNKTRKRVVTTTGIPVSEMGLLPPHNIELEEAILGACLLEAEAYSNIAEIIEPELFYKEQNQLVAKAIITLKNNNEDCDILTVTNELKRMGKLEFIGGSYYVSALTNRIASSANIEFHARIVQQDYIKRQAILSANQLIKKAYETASDCFDVIDEWEKSLTKITTKLFTERVVDGATLYNKVLEENKQKRDQPTLTVGINSGFKDVNRLLGGWQPSDLIILAARPGMGKTAFVLSTAREMVNANIPVAIFSLEMSAIQLYKRLCSQETEMPLSKFTKGLMDEADEVYFKKHMQNFRNAPIYIEDVGGLSIFQLRNKARKLKREKKVKAIIIDYLQLMDGDDNNREQEISKISRGLKSLAKELDVPIIALSQLSRKVEERPSKIPQLSDLRDSGSIEQDADEVFFLYRPEYYGMTVDGEGNSTAGMAKLITAKNRHGALEDIDLKWRGECTKFYDFDHNFLEEDTTKPLNNNEDFLNNVN